MILGVDISQPLNNQHALLRDMAIKEGETFRLKCGRAIRKYEVSRDYSYEFLIDLDGSALLSRFNILSRLDVYFFNI